MVYVGTSKATYKAFVTLLEDFKNVHGDTYDYSKVKFYNARTPVVITCKKHGEFLQRPRDHKRGQGCRQCFLERNASARTKDIHVLISELLSITKYNYPALSSAKAIKAHTKILIECAVCGTQKYSKVCNILTGYTGCKVCSSSKKLWTAERYEGSKATLYYIKICGLYKIGITKKGVVSRFYKEVAAGWDINVIFTLDYENGAEAFKEEQRILRENAKYRYKGDKVLLSGGDSELFTTDIFKDAGGVPSIR